MGGARLGAARVLDGWHADRSSGSILGPAVLDGARDGCRLARGWAGGPHGWHADGTGGSWPG